jgi:glycosyltransferase involved in cell wall biosynthesis
MSRATPGPRVCVGLPVFNGERYLAESLESLLAQDFTDFELVVADNASTDRTPQVLAEYAHRDPRIRVLRRETNIGGSENFNSLVWSTRAPLFKWAADDDLHDPRFIGACVAALDADPGAVLAYPKTYLIDAEGSLLREHEDRLHLDSEDVATRLRQFVERRWLCNPLFGVIRTDVLRRTSLERPYPSADVALLGELALAGRFHEVPERLFYRRYTPRSVGLGELDKAAVARWFRPSGRMTQIPPDVHVFLDLNRAIARSDLPVAQRVKAAAAFSSAWTKRRAAVALWKARTVRSGSAVPSIAESVGSGGRTSDR